MDNKAYMNEEEFSEVLKSIGGNLTELRDGYDAIFHLVTAAKGAEKYYTTANNEARKESAAEAAQLDDKLIAAWTGHPHLRVIDNSTGFEEKMKRLLAEISSFLGEPHPYEIERKFLIKYPDITFLEALPNCKRVEIIQTYLKSENDTEIRVRQRGTDGNYIYFRTEKRPIDNMKRIEIERRLSQSEYLRSLMDADTSKRQIRKTRYCLTHNNRYFEIDVYPFWNDRAVVEIELNHEDDKIDFPDWLNIIREITDDKAYRNSSIAEKIPE